MKYVERIAKIDQLERKQAIIDLLNGMGVPFELQSARVGDHCVENILVSRNPSDARLVIGAHYDSVDNSTGANDDASGCSVLLHLIDRLRDCRHSVDFVFFDREECVDHGSEAYLDLVGKERIAAMINLDMCGHGDSIVVSDKGNVGSKAFCGVLDTEMLEKHTVTTVGFLPNGDDDRFAACEIPNISVCTLYGPDIEFFQYLSRQIQEGKPLTEEDEKQFLSLDVVSTMHLGENDRIASCCQLCIDKVTEWLADGLMGDAAQ